MNQKSVVKKFHELDNYNSELSSIDVGLCCDGRPSLLASLYQTNSTTIKSRSNEYVY